MTFFISSTGQSLSPQQSISSFQGANRMATDGANTG
jgi:hypothetical protein